ncbi:hypothetical protein ABIA39_003443 [Nocardia sp. GAS34]|uniref:hypothetical protein n=1 Tax=unclassified Nocardia TaxID=2637762 RepID=UPI003D1ECE3E
MRSALALENLIARLPVICVGLAGMVRAVDEIAPPPVWVDHDGTVRIEADGWGTIGEAAGQHDRTWIRTP